VTTRARSVHLFSAASLVFVGTLAAQTVTLRGVVTDETGARVPSAKITVSGPGGDKLAASRDDGSYFFPSLATGDFLVRASAPDLILPQPVKITLSGGIQTLDLQLKVAGTTQQITVADSGAAVVNTDASNNASAMTLKGADLDALADDPEDLQADLQALAGPSAGPDGGAIFVDGFSDGQLPPKESIREIRINQNPFSPEYDKLGLGRIEIFTKPGADKFRGSIVNNLGDDFWDSRNPYAAQKATLRLWELETNFSGPLNRRTSFTLDVQRHAIDNGSIVDATTLDPHTLSPITFTATPLTPQRRFIVTPRVDFQLNASNTLMLRYDFTGYDIRDYAIGGFNLASRASHIQTTFNSIRGTETSVHGSTVNETRFQVTRYQYLLNANSQDPVLQVIGAFTGGGATNSHQNSIQNTVEVQNYTTMIHGAHIVKFGVRTRAYLTSDSLQPNFVGTFTFGGGLGPLLDSNNQPILDSSGQPVQEQIDAIERYRRTVLFQQLGYSPALIRSLGGGATQFSISAGNPSISGHQEDVGVFFGDDWRVAPNLTLNLGLRYEAQSNLHDWSDWAPRIGMAWAPGGAGQKQPKTVLRAGFGMFYDRFALNNTLAALRYGTGVIQQYVDNNPDYFPNVPPVSSLAGLQAAQVFQRVDPGARAPYVLQSALTVERQLPAGSTLAITYTRSRGVHALRSLDINAPLPGTFDPTKTGSGVFPMGNPNPLLLMTTSGVYDQNQLIANFNIKVRRSISLTGNYTYNRAQSNTDGLGTYPANPYNYTGEYGPASNDIRHRLSLGGTIDAKWGIRFSPLLNFQSGAPFNITTGTDLYGTTLFNARPGIATDPNKPGVIRTPYGLLDPDPTPGEALVPRNYGRGPGLYTVNLRVAKTIQFGPELPGANGAPGNRRFILTVSMAARNLLNHNNPGPIIGAITSPLFGQANQMSGGSNAEGFSENAANRRLEPQLRLTF
jgi:hypothetical protein